MANLDRIEVLKDPAATLYRRGLPGGVNYYVTKKPQARRETSLPAPYGSFDRCIVGQHSSPVIEMALPVRDTTLQGAALVRFLGWKSSSRGIFMYFCASL